MLTKSNSFNNQIRTLPNLQDGDDLLISAISFVELIYLSEKGKVPEDALQRLEVALVDESSGMHVVPLDTAIV